MELWRKHFRAMLSNDFKQYSADVESKVVLHILKTLTTIKHEK